MTKTDPAKPQRYAPLWILWAYALYKRKSKTYRRRVPFLYFLLGGKGTNSFKMGKAQSKYVVVSQYRDQQCATCKYSYQKVKSGKYICSQIQGEIKPEAWCALWRS